MSSYLVNTQGVPLHYNDAPSVSEAPAQMKRESDFSGGGYSGGIYDAPPSSGASYSPNESGFSGVVCEDPSQYRAESKPQPEPLTNDDAGEASKTMRHPFKRPPTQALTHFCNVHIVL